MPSGAWRAAALLLVLVLRPLSAVWAQTARIEPLFPQENLNIVFVEGEDAVSTNFSPEATLNYSASGKRTLQLSSAAGGDTGFYADYVFYVPATGDYELWYAGTPAGPLEDLYPSFFSPFRFRLDGGESVAVYREDIVVNENYAPAFYWNRVRPVSLEAGVHRLRFEVRERRRHDNRYYFYLDCFFLVRTEDGRPKPEAPLPAVFPRDLASTAIDRPFRSIDDYLVIVNQATERAQRISRLVELATVYSMVGDQVNALRYLARAALLDPENPEILLLQAKNQIWKGDLGDGIATYRRLLELAPERADLWLEAGKIAAWTARYEDSVDLLTRGLERFSEDLDLRVNLGLTYLWSSRVADADRMFRGSLAAASDPARLKYLADVYRVNGYTERAVSIYRVAIEREPADLESHLLLEGALRELGHETEADGVRRGIEETFVPSTDLDRYLATYRVKQGLVQATIAEYVETLDRDPDNLDLRQLLAQTYFWNGLGKQAIGEYLNILATHAYGALRELDAATPELQRALDSSYLAAGFLAGVPEAGRAVRADLEARQRDLGRAQADLLRAQGAAAAASGAEGADAQPAASGAAFEQAATAAMVSVGRARELVSRLEAAEAFRVGWSLDLDRLAETQAEEQRLFGDLVRPSRWSWDRRAAIAEASARAADGLGISNYTVARIAQIERRYPAAAGSFTLLGDGEAAFAFGRSQSVLWEGKQGPGPYLSVANGLPEDAVPYRAAIGELARSLGLEAVPVEPESPVLLAADEVPAALEGTSADLGTLLAVVESARRAIADGQRRLHRFLYEAMVRSFYRYEERTVGLRNELGDAYLRAGERSAAIRHYRYVLAIDPTNLDAIFRLGSTSALAGDWSEALRYYERVWTTDPYFENVAALHNRIALEHGDTVQIGGAYSAEGSRASWVGTGAYTLPITSYLGVTARYIVGSHRRTVLLPNPLYAEAVAHHIAYTSQVVSVAVPVRLYGLGLTLEPGAGVSIIQRSQYFVGDTGQPSYPTADLFGAGQDLGPLQFLQAHVLHPYAGLAVDFERQDALRVQGTFRVGTYDRTEVEPLTARTSLEGSLALSPVLGSLDVPVLRDVYLRGYGEITHLPATGVEVANTIWLSALDIVVPFRFSSALSPTVAVEGSLYYTDSTTQTPIWEYYAPRAALTVKGGLTGTLSIPVGSERLGLTVHAAGGYAGRYDSFQDARTGSALIEGSAGASLTRRGGTLGLRVALNTALGVLTGALDYWSLAVELDFTARMPRLLLPR